MDLESISHHERSQYGGREMSAAKYWPRSQHEIESRALSEFTQLLAAFVTDNAPIQPRVDELRNLLVSFAEKAAKRRQSKVVSRRSIALRWPQAVYIARSLAILDNGRGRSPFHSDDLTALYDEQRELVGRANVVKGP